MFSLLLVSISHFTSPFFRFFFNFSLFGILDRHLFFHAATSGEWL